MDYSPHALLDIRFPDFSARHVFTAKLRLVIIIGWWAMCIFFYPGLLTLDQPILLIVSATFTVTTICYGFILRGIAPVLFFILELVADVATQTVLIYLTGGAKSSFFTIYIIYCCSGGLFYNYKVSAVIGFLCLLFYSGLLLALHYGWVDFFNYPFHEIVFFQPKGNFPSAYLNNWLLLALFLVVVIYGIRIAHHFTQVRENALEEKNRELTSLNKISSTTRGRINLEQVKFEVIRGVKQGLGYEEAFLVAQNEQGVMKIFMTKDSPYAEVLEKELGLSLMDATFSLDSKNNLLAQVMKTKKVSIRYELSAVTMGALPDISVEQATQLQDKLGFKKFIVAPLVAEQKVLGVLVGMTRNPWIEPEAVKAFEGFADQAALVIDNVLLIERLRRQNAELERVSRVKSEFLSTMSHELRTPLTAIIGFSELLLDGAMGEMSADQKESLREVLTNGESLLDLINSLLDLAKIEAGKMEFQPGPVDLPRLLERVQGMIFSLLQKKGHEFHLSIPPQLALVYADEKKLQQILLNLLSNAIKFTPDGGRIEVTVKEQTDHSLEIAIHDNGIGIKPQHIDRIFDSFEQADSSYTREHQGTGLGLALTRQFVQLHGGKIWVKSAPDQGSIFTFTLPKNF